MCDTSCGERQTCVRPPRETLLASHLTALRYVNVTRLGMFGSLGVHALAPVRAWRTTEAVTTLVCATAGRGYAANRVVQFRTSSSRINFGGGLH